VKQVSISEGQAFLTVLSGPAEGERLEVPVEGLLIGRGDGTNGAFASDLAVSHQHAQVSLRADGSLVIEDLNSTNGTRVNGVTVAGPLVLTFGDLIEAGATTLRVDPYQRLDETAVLPPSEEVVRPATSPLDGQADFSASTANPNSGDALDQADAGSAKLACPACGASSPVGTQICPVCSSSLTASAAVPSTAQPSPRGWAIARPSAPTAAVAASKAAPTKHATSGKTLEGVVRDLNWRSEPYGSGRGGRTEQILAFSVDRFDAEGRQLPSIPVEMRARSIRGKLSNGDRVAIQRRWKEGDLLRPKKVQNLSDGGAWVQTKGRSHRLLWFFIIVLIVAAVLLIQHHSATGRWL